MLGVVTESQMNAHRLALEICSTYRIALRILLSLHYELCLLYFVLQIDYMSSFVRERTSFYILGQSSKLAVVSS